MTTCPRPGSTRVPNTEGEPEPAVHSEAEAGQGTALARRLRVMHIITRLIVGGAQENTLLTVEDLIHDHGDAVLLVTGPAPGPEGDLFDRVARRQTPCVVVEELQRAISPIKDAIAYHRLKRIIREWQPDVVHTHSSKAGILGRAAAAAVGVPVVVHTVHGSPFHPFERPWRNALYRRAERWAARRCHGLIAVSNAMRDLYLEHGIGVPERFAVIYSGMEVEAFERAQSEGRQLRQQLGLAPDEIVIGKVARLFHLKGHEFVLDAAPRVLARAPNVKFLFVGDGVLRDEFERRVRQLGIADRFVFVGLVPPDQIPAYLHAMDIVVHCSLREGLARVLVQAKLAGKPVVSFHLDGAWEVVRDGESGFLVSAGDTEALVDRLTRLAESETLREQMGQAGREPLRRRFDHHYMTEQIRAFYVRLLQQRPMPGAQTSRADHKTRRR